MKRLSLLLPLALLVCSTAARATWSIILVDKRTGEIAIGSATCVPGYDLKYLASVVVVGKGAAAAQSYVDMTGRNRYVIFTGLQKGTSPTSILATLAKQDSGHQTRQYGIVDTKGRAVGFTGTSAFTWKGHLTGTVGTITYAIQGNILTGAPVIKKAELAIRNTTGDLGTKLLAGMEAARAMGGDGRCSCSSSNPTGCGSPPKSFKKSSDIGYLVIARPGDKDGLCSGRLGCANGKYYLDLNVANQSRTQPDPVLQLKKLYATWRSGLRGRPDHFKTRVLTSVKDLPIDGRTQAYVDVELRDIDDQRISPSSVKLTATLDASSTAQLSLGAARNHGAGRYRIPVTAGRKQGLAKIRLVVDDGKGKVELGPLLQIPCVADNLWASKAALSTTLGGKVEFSLQAGSSGANKPYVLVASASGTSPGIRVSPSLVVPVNPDLVFQLFLSLVNSPVLPGALGRMDANGNGLAAFVVPPLALTPLVGRTLHFAYATHSPIDFASPARALKLVR